MAGAVKSAVAPGSRLQGKVAVITGGASGIGEATAKLFAAQGAKVIIADINETEGERVAREIGGPDVALFVRCDVAKEDDIAAAVDLSVSAFGGLDIMYNNAGIVGPKYPIDETPAERLDHLYSVNFRGAFLGIKHAARIMKPQKRGCIISTASVAGHVAGQAPHPYTALKHALVGLTRSAAFELRKYQIRVNAVSPGAVLTNVSQEFPGGKAQAAQLEALLSSTNWPLESTITRAENIASAVLFLASDDAAYVSGHSMLVDGGHAFGPTTPRDAIYYSDSTASASV